MRLKQFERLVESEGSASAIGGLCASFERNLGADNMNAGLSEPAYDVFLCLVYICEVLNGGQIQFLWNRHATAHDTLIALERMGLATPAENLKLALDLLPEYFDAHDVDDIDDDALDAWDRRDQMIADRSGELEGRLVTYVRSHAKRIFRQ